MGFTHNHKIVLNPISLKGLDVLTTRCWTSLQVKLGLASRARAMMAEAMAALPEVPDRHSCKKHFTCLKQ